MGTNVWSYLVAGIWKKDDLLRFCLAMINNFNFETEHFWSFTIVFYTVFISLFAKDTWKRQFKSAWWRKIIKNLNFWIWQGGQNNLVMTNCYLLCRCYNQDYYSSLINSISDSYSKRWLFEESNLTWAIKSLKLEEMGLFSSFLYITIFW